MWCALAIVALLHFCGNATRGYIPTSSLFVWWGTQWFDPGSETEHGPIVVVLSLFLFWRNLRRAPRAHREMREEIVALAAMLGGMLLHLVGYTVQQTRVSIAALAVMTWGVLVLAGGKRWGQAAVFPLGFLMLAIPLNALDSLGFYLRLWVTQTTEVLARGMEIGVIRNGTQLFAPDGSYQYDVAAACSGVRSLVALMAMALLVGYLRFATTWRRVVLALLTIPYAFVGNLVRILAIVCTGEWVGQRAGERVHDWSGWLVFAVVLGLLLATARVLRETPSAIPDTTAEGPRSPESVGRADARAKPKPAWVAVIVLLAMLLAAGATSALDALPVRTAAGVRLAENGKDPLVLPAFLGADWMGRMAEVTAVERDLLPADTGYSRRHYVQLDDPSRSVFFSIVLSGRDRTSIHRPELCLVGQGWTIEHSSRRAFPVREDSVETSVLRIRREIAGPDGTLRVQRALLAYWFVSSDHVVPSHRTMLWRDALSRLRHGRADRWAYVLAQTALEGDEQAAWSRLGSVIEGLWPQVKSEPSLRPASAQR